MDVHVRGERVRSTTQTDKGALSGPDRPRSRPNRVLALSIDLPPCRLGPGSKRRRAGLSVDPKDSRPGKRVRTHFTGVSCEMSRLMFTPSRAWQRFCSASCRSAARRDREAARLREVLARMVPDDPGRPE